MKGAGDTAGENGYDPTRFARGGVVEGERTGAGLTDKHQTHSIRIPIRGVKGVADGTHAIPYPWIIGAPFLSEDNRRIAFTFAGELWNGEDWTEGRWTVIINGSKHLEKLYAYISEARRKGIDLGGGGREDDWHVDEIKVFAVE